MSLPSGDDPEITRTAHAMLIPWGVFARQVGLVQALEGVSIPQRRGEHAPQTKLMEFLVAILSGCAYLQDISHGPHPLDQDQAVATAWGQADWADYSGISRTLHACTAETVAAVRTALWQVSRPFMDREVMLALRERGALVYDGDLTGRPVSSTSKTYPGAAFGWMDDAVRLGYQAALVSMASPSYGRLWLSVRVHPGDTVSCPQAEAMVRQAEASTGVRPRRRTELVAGRIQEKQGEVQAAQRRLGQGQDQLEAARSKMNAMAREWRRALAEVARLVERDGSVEKAKHPYSQLSKARQKVGVYWRRLYRCSKAMEGARQAAARQAEKASALQAELAALEQHLVRLVEDNRTNRAPIPAIFRLDGGFGSGKNLAWLIEMGYEVYGKVISDKVTGALRRRMSADLRRTPVGDNAEMVAWSALKLDFCPYPLDMGLEHFYTGQKERFATLVHYGPQPVAHDLRGWFDFYNGRQTIEAGVKEGKSVFEMHHLKVRSVAGLAIQEEFASFAANLVRWAAAWLYEQRPAPPAPFDRPQPSVKRLVRVAANTTAVVSRQPEGSLLLRFDELSPWKGSQLRIPSGWALQPPLPLFTNEVLEPT